MNGPRSSAAVLVLALVGCGGVGVMPGDGGAGSTDGGGTDGAPSSGELVVGGSDGTTFELVEDGQDVPLHPGAQGGFHVFLHLRARGLAPGPLTIERTGRRVSDDQLVTRARDRRVLDPVAIDAAGWLQIVEPMLVFMCPSPIGVNVIDEPIRYQLDVTDASMQTARATVTLRTRCPPAEDPQREFCLSICKG
jgi:hypothetical protein